MRVLPGLLRRGSSVPVESGALIPLLDEGGLVPQGLAHDAGSGQLVYTFYEAADPSAGVLVLADPEGGIRARVPLHGLDHYGGVAVAGGRTWVCGGGLLQVHDTARLRRGRGDPIATVPVRASSTVTAHADGLYVAAFHRSRPGRVYRYDLDPDGRPVETGVVLTAPPRTQGVAFEEDGTVHFSRSWGRTSASVLTRVSAADLAADRGWTAQNGRDTLLPPMAEGSVIIAGRLHQLYESGAAPYRRYARAHLLLTLLRGPLAPRERLSVHDLGTGATRGTGAGTSP